MTTPLAHFRTWLRTTGYLTDTDFKLVAPVLQMRNLKAGEKLQSEGQIPREVGFLTRGAFRKYLTQDDKEINTWFFFEGECVFDFKGLSFRQPSRYYLEALEDSELVLIPLKKLDLLYNTSRNWERFGRIMAEKLHRQTMERVEFFQLYNGRERYRRLLETRPELFERVPVYHLASYLGMEPQSLSRLRGELARSDRK